MASRYHLTDIGNARRFVAWHGRDLRYCHTVGQWMVWRGNRWQPDDNGGVMRRAIMAARTIYQDAAAAEDETSRAELTEHALRTETAERLDAMVRLAQSEQPIAARASEFDAAPYLLNCPNGTVDLRTGAVRPHRREDQIARITAAPMDPSASSNAWRLFLLRALKGDRARLALLQRYVGRSLIGGRATPYVFLLAGAGRTDIRLFLSTLTAALGDYALVTTPDLLWRRITRGDEPMCPAHRMVACVESLAGAAGPTVTLGQLADAWGARPQGVLWLPTEADDATAAPLPIDPGLRGLPFGNAGPDQRPAASWLAPRLAEEAGGILAWAVEGSRLWHETGLSGVARGALAAREAKHMDVARLFALGNQPSGRRGRMRSRVRRAYEAHRRWCGEPRQEP